MSQTQKLSMKSARDRPSSNLGFNLQASEQKPPRDRSQQNTGHPQQSTYPLGGAASGKTERHSNNPIGVPLHNSFFNISVSERSAVGNQTMVVPNKHFKPLKQPLQ